MAGEDKLEVVGVDVHRREINWWWYVNFQSDGVVELSALSTPGPSRWCKSSFLRTKNLVVFKPTSSSMFSARHLKPCFSPASLEQMAAGMALRSPPSRPEACCDPSRATRAAAADVLPTSILSTWGGGWCRERNLLHWPQTWGCV